MMTRSRNYPTHSTDSQSISSASHTDVGSGVSSRHSKCKSSMRRESDRTTAPRMASSVGNNGNVDSNDTSTASLTPGFCHAAAANDSANVQTNAVSIFALREQNHSVFAIDAMFAQHDAEYGIIATNSALLIESPSKFEFMIGARCLLHANSTTALALENVTQIPMNRARRSFVSIGQSLRIRPRTAPTV